MPVDTQENLLGALYKIDALTQVSLDVLNDTPRAEGPGPSPIEEPLYALLESMSLWTQIALTRANELDAPTAAAIPLPSAAPAA